MGTGGGDTTLGNVYHVTMYVGSPPDYLYVHEPDGTETFSPIRPSL
jgi:hypothetical protein